MLTASPVPAATPSQDGADHGQREQEITAYSYKTTYRSGTLDLEKKLKVTTDGDGSLSYQCGQKDVLEVSGDGSARIKGCGKATVTIHASETSSCRAASRKVTVTILPQKVSLTSVRAKGGRKIQIRWKPTGGIDAYQLQVSRKKNFQKDTLNKSFGKAEKGCTVSKLSRDKRYHVRIRAYKKFDKKKYYGTWSKVKSVVVR